MICPFCLHKKSSVFNSRTTSGGAVTWRRRRCQSCNQAFTTQESFNPSGIWQVQKNKSIGPYSRAKLIMSLLRACDHRNDQDDAIWYLFEIIEQKLSGLAAENAGILQAAEISETAATVLKRFDLAAYVKYASRHQPAMNNSTLRKQLRKK